MLFARLSLLLLTVCWIVIVFCISSMFARLSSLPYFLAFYLNYARHPSNTFNLKIFIFQRGNTESGVLEIFTINFFHLSVLPLHVSITSQREPLVSDEMSDIFCLSFGSRPSPSISWWLDGTALKHHEQKVRITGYWPQDIGYRKGITQSDLDIQQF